MAEDQIIIYQLPSGKTTIDVKVENDTIWLTLNQIADLFGKSNQQFPGTFLIFTAKKNYCERQLLQRMQQFKTKEIVTLKEP